MINCHCFCRSLSFLLVVSSALFPIPVRADKVDDYVKAQMQKSHTPAVSVAVVRKGKVVLAKGYGLANVEVTVPATKDTVYEVLSISKQFTAAAVLLLVEEGKVGLDEAVARYLTDTPASWNDVTVRHVLTHTSGIKDYTDVRPFFEMIRQDATPEELIKPVKELPLLFAPGSQWRYSNSNYYLLGLIIEKVSGQKYAEFLRKRIFQPLGMTATRVNDMTDIVPNRADGYHWINENVERMPAFLSGYHGIKNVLQNAIYVSPTRKWAAGAILSTVTDLAKWDAVLYTERLLKKATLDQMWTPARLNSGVETSYGFGNELSTVRGHRVAGHQGGGMAFNATLLRYVDDGLTVIVLCNQTSAPSKPMAARIATFYLPSLSYEQDKGIEDKESEVTALLKGVLQKARQGEADAVLFAAEAQEFVGFVRRAGPGYLGPRGAMKSLVLLERKNEGKQRFYRYRVLFEDATLLWTLTLNENGKILSLNPMEE